MTQDNKEQFPEEQEMKDLLEKHRKMDDTVPHWITMKHALLAMKEYASRKSFDKKEVASKAIDDFIHISSVVAGFGNTVINELLERKETYLQNI